MDYNAFDYGPIRKVNNAYNRDLFFSIKNIAEEQVNFWMLGRTEIPFWLHKRT